MKLKVLLLLFGILFLKSANGEHPLKMTFSKLIVSSNGNVELETRIFLDDLTNHMEKLYGLIHAEFSSTGSNGTQALQNYFKNHFYLEQGKNQINLIIQNVSLSKNQLALVVNLNTSNQLDTSKDVFVVNTVLCDASPLQVNDIKYNDKHFKLSIGKPKVKIPLN